jgi:hypothetical protein
MYQWNASSVLSRELQRLTMDIYDTDPQFSDYLVDLEKRARELEDGDADAEKYAHLREALGEIVTFADDASVEDVARIVEDHVVNKAGIIDQICHVLPKLAAPDRRGKTPKVDFDTAIDAVIDAAKEAGHQLDDLAERFDLPADMPFNDMLEAIYNKGIGRIRDAIPALETADDDAVIAAVIVMADTFDALKPLLPRLVRIGE